MKRQTTLLLAALLLGGAGCDESEPTKPTPADQVPPHPVASAPSSGSSSDASATKPRQSEDTAEGALDLGDRFAAFEILNCESGEVYCQVCRYGPNPKLMAVGTIDDEAFKKDLRQLDALVDKFGADKVKAFAVIASTGEGALVTPMEDTDALVAQVKALRQELELSFPVVIPAAKDGQRNEVFEDYYNIARSRTIMFTDGGNHVRYSEVAPSNLDALDEAIAAAIAS